MRTSHIAWIGAVLTFAVVLGIGLWKESPPVAESPAKTAAADAPVRAPDGAPAAQLSDAPVAVAGANTAPSAVEPQPSGDPVEDGRAMLEAAQSSADAGVRDEAAALTQALAGENAPQEP